MLGMTLPSSNLHANAPLRHGNLKYSSGHSWQCPRSPSPPLSLSPLLPQAGRVDGGLQSQTPALSTGYMAVCIRLASMELADLIATLQYCDTL